MFIDEGTVAIFAMVFGGVDGRTAVLIEGKLTDKGTVAAFTTYPS
jgi:hypothetical protein